MHGSEQENQGSEQKDRTARAGPASIRCAEAAREGKIQRPDAIEAIRLVCATQVSQQFHPIRITATPLVLLPSFDAGKVRKL